MRSEDILITLVLPSGLPALGADEQPNANGGGFVSLIFRGANGLATNVPGMSTYVGLLRGINVGGTGKLPMSELKLLMANLGCENIKTYIQSGNVVFDAEPEEWNERISDAIDSSIGFRPRVLTLTDSEFRSVAAGNPFPTDEPKATHVYFLDGTPSWTAKTEMESVKSDLERFYITDAAVYLHTPEFLSGSRLAPKLERLIGVPATARNWRTVEKILAMLDER